MLFELTLRFPGVPELTVSDDSLTTAVGTAWAQARRTLRLDALDGVLGHAEPFLPAIAQAAGVGVAGQIGVQVATALARRALGHAGRIGKAAEQAAVAALPRPGHDDSAELPPAPAA